MWKFKLRTRVLALVMSVVMTVTLAPEVLAEGADQLADDPSWDVVLTDDGAGQPQQQEEAGETFVLYELVEERQANEKRFRMSDGSVVVSMFDTAVHYEDSGTWKEIDNSLSADNADGVDGYVNQANGLAVKFAQNSAEDYLLWMQADGCSLTWSLPPQVQAAVYTADAASSQAAEIEIVQGAADASADQPNAAQPNSVQQAQEEAHPDAAFAATSNVQAQVAYEDLYPGVDLEYFLRGDKIKENIILKERGTRTSFTFLLEAEGLTLVLEEDGSIGAYPVDAEEGTPAQWRIPTPYLYDAAGVISMDAAFTLESLGGGRWELTVTADEDWVNDADRVFPVTIDPAMETEQDRSTIDTIFVSSASPDTCYNTNNVLEIGHYRASGKTVTSQAYLNFDEPTLEQGSAIVSARLNLYGMRREVYGQQRTLYLYELTEPFSSSGNNKTTWNNQPSASSTALDYHILPVGIKENEWHSYDVTRAVQQWTQGGAQNGFLLKAESATGDSNLFKMNYVSEALNTASSGAYPFLLIQYRNTYGLEDYWTYTSMPAGRGGTASINNFNGNCVIVHPLLGIDGNRMPVSLSLVYNSAYLGTYQYTRVGNGWKLNYDIQLVNSSHLESYPGYLLDADGTKHYFYMEDGDTEAKDEDGLGYTLTSSGGYKIKDKDGNTMYFDDYNSSYNVFLTKIEDTNGNTLTIDRDTSNRITKITDGAGRAYTFTYTGNLLTKITDPAGQSVTLGYYNSELYQITYPDGKTITQSYSGINNADGTYTSLVKQDGRITEMAWKSGSTVHTSYGFTYKKNETDVTDNHGRTVTYQFNNFGQTTGIVDQTSGMAQYYAYGAPVIGGTGDVNMSANHMTQASRVQQTSANLIDNPGFDTNPTSGYYAYGTGDNASGNWSMGWPSKGRTGANSISISRTALPTGSDIWLSATQTQTGYLSPGWYTFSAYVNTNNVEMTGDGARVGLVVTDANGNFVKSVRSLPVKKTGVDDWERVSVSVELGANQRLKAAFGLLDNNTLGTAYFDDLQLEYAETAGPYNLVQNGIFYRNGTYTTSHWSATGATLGVSANSASAPAPGYSGVVKGNPSGQVTIQSQKYSVSGKKGDVFSFGAWSKATSAAVDGIRRDVYESADGGAYNPKYQLEFKFFNGASQVGDTVVVPYNSYVTTWQFRGAQAIATGNYTSVQISLRYDYNLNYAYLNTPYIYKESYGASYTYDKDGNVASAVDTAEAQTDFASKDNQLAKLATPAGGAYLYTYQQDTNNLLYANGTSGQEYKFTYDQFGNALTSEIYERKYETNLQTGKAYYIRNRYSGNALTIRDNGGYVYGYNYDPSPEEDSGPQRWVLVSTGESGVYYLRPESKSYASLYASAGYVRAQITQNSDSEKFKLVKQSDGSFLMYTKNSGYTDCVDGQPNGTTEVTNTHMPTIEDYKAGDDGQKWYFYAAQPASGDKLTSSATYSADGNQLMSLTDAAGNTTEYGYYESGQDKYRLRYVEDPMGINNTWYFYDDAGRVRSVWKNNSWVNYVYNEKDQLEEIQHNQELTSTAAEELTQQRYEFTYDAFGRTTQTTVATEKDGGRSSRTLSSNTYNSWNQLSRSTYGNGQYVSYTYDDLDRVKTKQHSGITGSFRYTYDQQGNLARVKDTVNNTLTGFFYDLAGRLSEIRQTDANETQERINLEYTYDEYNRLKAYAFTVPGVSEQRMEARFGDGSAGFDAERVYGVKWNGTEVLQHVYDGLGRKTQDILKMGGAQRATQYTYLPGKTAGTTTTQVGTVTYADGTVETYTYDERGYISSIHSSGDNKKVEYTYDTLGQLVREDNERENYTVTWEYDKGGNLLSRKVYAYTTGSTLGEPLATDTYGYDDAAWGDLLTSYNGQSITYDAIGNPLSYRGAALTWKAGRQLAAWSKDGTNISYTYDDSGIRTKKVVNGETTEYYILDGTLLGMSGKVDSLPYTLVFRFDEGGNAIGFQLTVSGYGTQAYWYQRNLQGDVIGIYNGSGTLIGRYTYDAWGKLLNTELLDSSFGGIYSYVLELNPIRYRGYLYDTETALYYCQSRYYDPEVGRWINADGFTSTGQSLTGYNMFSYCGNQPISRNDLSGAFWKEIGDFFKGVGEKIEEVGTSIVNAGKKLVKAAVGSFHIEGGVGYGLGVSASVGPVKASAEAYHDPLTIGLSNGETYTAAKGNISIGIKATKKASLAVSTEYEHRYETDLRDVCRTHTTLSSPVEVYNCPSTEKDPLQVSVPIVKPIEGTFSKGTFIGIGGSFHVGVGFHYSIGWDASEFWKILTE